MYQIWCVIELQILGKNAVVKNIYTLTNILSFNKNSLLKINFLLHWTTSWLTRNTQVVLFGRYSSIARVTQEFLLDGNNRRTSLVRDTTDTSKRHLHGSEPWWWRDTFLGTLWHLKKCTVTKITVTSVKEKQSSPHRSQTISALITRLFPDWRYGRHAFSYQCVHAWTDTVLLYYSCMNKITQCNTGQRHCPDSDAVDWSIFDVSGKLQQ